MISNRTKQCQRLAFLFGFLSFILLLIPFGYYAVVAFMTAGVVQKLGLGVMFFVAAAVYAFCLLQKYQPRSIIWIMVIGMYIALQNIMPLIIAVAAVSILDEFIFTPLAKRYRELARTNKEIDRR
jgi:hypothetical protein